MSNSLKECEGDFLYETWFFDLENDVDGD